MRLRDLGGTFVESGIWQDTRGNGGELCGRIIMTNTDECLSFQYEDGSSQTSGLITAAVMNTSLDGESSTGKLYLGGNTMILEYVVDVGGRVERNTDCWVFLKDAIARTGVIRQADRVIWFEAEMSHTH